MPSFKRDPLTHLFYCFIIKAFTTTLHHFQLLLLSNRTTLITLRGCLLKMRPDLREPSATLKAFDVAAFFQFLPTHLWGSLVLLSPISTSSIRAVVYQGVFFFFFFCSCNLHLFIVIFSDSLYFHYLYFSFSS